MPTAKTTDAASEAQEAAAPAGDDLVEAVVRHGTIHTGEPDNVQTFGPGEKVRLPAATVASLRAAGFLHDPESAPAFAAGPSVTADDGPVAQIG